jgi:hypothetical protein
MADKKGQAGRVPVNKVPPPKPTKDVFRGRTVIAKVPPPPPPPKKTK